MAVGTTTKKGTPGKFTAEERAAMRERAKELKAEALQASGEKEVLAKIAAMKAPDRAMAKKLHAVIMGAVPEFSPRTWYGFPSYAIDGNIVCFFKPAEKFNTRYATLGFSDKAKLDDGNIWPAEYALKKLEAAEEKKVAALVEKAVR